MDTVARLGIPRPDRTQLGLFLALWLPLGFAAGTVTLLGPVRWVTGIARSSGWSPSAEDWMVRAVICVYVLLSALLAMVATRMTRRRPWARIGVPAIAVLAAIGSLTVWMTPAWVNGLATTEVSSVARFTFGPYPERARFEELRDEGYTAVVSLLHPAVVPFEPALLSRERELAEEFGLELIHAPMLPWVSDNEESLARIANLVQQGTGRYYVHCYLGRDRVGLVRGLVNRLTGQRREAVAETVRSLEGTSAFVRGSFERGPIYRLAPGVYLTPFPTDDEFVKYVLGGSVSTVVSLLDERDPADDRWLQKERSLMAEHTMPLVSVPVPQNGFRPADVRAAIDAIRGAAPPVLVHDYHSDSSLSEALRWSWASGLPPVDPRGFREPLARGAVELASPHVVVGPRPEGPEFGSRLERWGIIGIIRVGPVTPGVAEDRRVVEAETGLRWVQLGDAEESVETLESGGPWYVYGPGSEGVAAIARARWGQTPRSTLGARAVAAGQGGR